MSWRPTLLFVSLEDPFEPHGGSAVRARMLLLQLANDAAVTLIVADGRPSRPIPEGDPLSQKCERIHFLGFVRHGWRRRLSQFLKLTAPRLDLRFQGLTAAISSLGSGTGHHFDIGVVSYTFLAHAGRDARRACDTLVLDAHNVEWKTRTQHAGGRISPMRRWRWGILAWALRYFERRELRVFDAVWAVSENEAGYFSRTYPYLRVDVIPNVVAGIRAERESDCRDPGVLFVGSLATTENTNAALWLIHHVIPLVRRVRSDVKFIIAGRNPPSVLQSDHGNGIEVVPNPSDIAPLYRRAIVAAVPLLEGSGTRIKIIEAFAAGVPVVSTPLGADGLNIVNGRHLLLATTAGDFASALLRLLDDRVLRSRLASEGYALQQSQYSPAALQITIRACLGELAAERAI